MDDAAATVVAPRASEPGAGETGFASFFAQHHEALFRALWLLTRDPDEAEEVSQEAFLRVWERWDRVSAGPDPVAYLYRTAMNHWRSRLRRMAVAARMVVHQTWREDGIEGVESRDVVVRSLAALPPRLRAAVYEVVSGLHGVTVIEDARDPAGRPAVALERSERADGDISTWRTFFDARTHQAIAWTFTSSRGGSAWILLESAIVESPGDAPEPDEWLAPPVDGKA